MARRSKGKLNPNLNKKRIDARQLGNVLYELAQLYNGFIPKKACYKVVYDILYYIAQEIVDGNDIDVYNFGLFTSTIVAAQHNAIYGELPARMSCRFRPGKFIKQGLKYNYGGKLPEEMGLGKLRDGTVVYKTASD